jgi:hypothetical protein
MAEPTFDPTLTTPLEQMQDRLDFARKLQELTNKIHGTDNVDQIMLDLSSRSATCSSASASRCTCSTPSAKRWCRE